MRYLGIDVHVTSTVFCLLDQQGNVVDHGKIPTTIAALQELAKRLAATEELLVGQEVGKMTHLVHDALTAIGIKVLSFNAYHLRLIASSRKKTDKRDAYWIARTLQSGMMPHPVYVPTGQVRRLRSLLSQRQAVNQARKAWLMRARGYLQANGYKLAHAHRTVRRMMDATLMNPEGVDAHLHEALTLCERMESTLTIEEKRLSKTIWDEAKGVPAVKRLMTIPAVGERVAVMVYAWVGDVMRFKTARELASYAGLVPSVWQSGQSQRQGGITKMGSPQLRSVLTQAAHVLLFRCHGDESAPLRAIAERVHKTRARRKIAVIAAARHILRISYYVLRDGTEYDPKRLTVGVDAATNSAA